MISDKPLDLIICELQHEIEQLQLENNQLKTTIKELEGDLSVARCQNQIYKENLF